MSKNPEAKLAAKREALLARTAQALGVSESEATALLRIPRRQSVRLNPLQDTFELKYARSELDYLTDSSLKQFAWMPEGYMYTRESSPHAVRDSRLAAEGRVFIQNAASWLPVLALEPQAGELILDVCAAPGGKTSHIAAITNNQAQIVANDNSRPRLAKLQANLTRLGVKNVELTLFDATQLARKLHGRQFDKILLDAPCSGEGMMQLDRDKDFTTWSVAHIKRLQQLQRRILLQAWQLLRPGGTLVYSTCTMAPEENEAVVAYLLRNKDDAEIRPFTLELSNRVPAVSYWNGKAFDAAIANCMRLKPSENVEAFFVAMLVKRS